MTQAVEVLKVTNQKRDVNRDGISPEKALRDIWYVHDGCSEPKE